MTKTQDEMIDRLVPDVAEDIHGEDLVSFLEFFKIYVKCVHIYIYIYIHLFVIHT